MSCCIVTLKIKVLALILPFICPFFLSFKAKFVSQFSQELCKLESSNMVYICSMSDCIVVLRLRVMAFIFFYPFFFLSLYKMLTFKICVGVFSETFKARMLKLSIHMDNELLYCGIENQTPCSYSPLYLFVFLSFKAKFVSQFSQELWKLESSNMAFICRMSDCIVGLRLRVKALILLFYPFFFVSFYCILTLKIYVSFLRKYCC